MHVEKRVVLTRLDEQAHDACFVISFDHEMLIGGIKCNPDGSSAFIVHQLCYHLTFGLAVGCEQANRDHLTLVHTYVCMYVNVYIYVYITCEKRDKRK